MSSVTEGESRKAMQFIKKALEPAIEELIVEANKVLAKHDLHIGASVEWYIDKITNKEKSDNEKS